MTTAATPEQLLATHRNRIKALEAAGKHREAHRELAAALVVARDVSTRRRDQP